MSKIFKRPPWLPPPSSWVRAVSIIPFLPAGVITVFLPLALWLLIFDPESRLFGVLMTVASVSVLLIVAAIYAVCHHRFVEKQNNWLPASISQWKGLYASLVLTISMIPSVLLAALLTNRRYGYSSSYLVRKTEIPGHVVFLSMTVFIVLAAFLFYIESAVRKELDN